MQAKSAQKLKMQKQIKPTLHERIIAVIAERDMLAAAVMSSWRVELPADTDLAVAKVTALIARMNCSGVTATFGGSSPLKDYMEVNNNNIPLKHSD